MVPSRSMHLMSLNLYLSSDSRAAHVWYPWWLFGCPFSQFAYPPEAKTNIHVNVWTSPAQENARFQQ